MNNNISINIADIVEKVKEIMKDHAPVETMYNDILEPLETEIPLDSCISQWTYWLENHNMSYEDFVGNIIMAILSEICGDISLNDFNPYDFAERRKVDLRQRKIIKTKEKVYNESLYDGQPYFRTVKQKNLSGIFHKELLLVLHEFVNDSQEEGKSINPLLKLVSSQNINFEHFSIADLEDVIDYYKAICEYVFDESAIETFEKMMIMYHLEVETRFSTIFQMLQCIKGNMRDEEKEALYHLRGICRKTIIRGPQGDMYQYQNIIYFGKTPYIKALASYCNQGEIDNIDKLLNCIYEIVIPIYVIRDTIITSLKQAHSKHYTEFVNNTYNDLVLRMKTKKYSSPYEEMLLREMAQLRDEYDGFKSENIRVDHFIRMYVSDDKIENLKISELHKKDKVKRRDS